MTGSQLTTGFLRYLLRADATATVLCYHKYAVDTGGRRESNVGRGQLAANADMKGKEAAST